MSSNRAWRAAARAIQRRDVPGAKWVPLVGAPGPVGRERAAREGRLSYSPAGEEDGYWVGPAARLVAAEAEREAAYEAACEADGPDCDGSSEAWGD